MLDRAELLALAGDDEVGARILSACPSQVMVWRKRSNSSSSVMPDMYMNRFLKVGDASWKMVWQPGSWHTDIAAKARMRGSWR